MKRTYTVAEAEEFGLLEPREKPKPAVLIAAMRRAIDSAAGLDIMDRMEHAHETRRCLWANQNRDGRRYRTPVEGRKSSPAAFFDGSSDARVRLVEETLLEHVKIMQQATARADLSIQPRDLSPDDDRFSRSNLWRQVAAYFLDKMDANIRKKSKRLANIREEFGRAVLFIDWEETLELAPKTLDLGAVIEQIAEQTLDAIEEDGDRAVQAPIVVQDLVDQFADPERDGFSMEQLRGVDPAMSDSEARRALKSLRTSGSATYWAPRVASAQPRWQALTPWINVFYPVETQEIQDAPWVAWVEWVSAVELRSRGMSKGYDPDWIERVLATTPDQLPSKLSTGNNAAWMLAGLEVGMSIEPVATRDDTANGLWPVFHVWHRAVTQTGLPCIYHTVLHPEDEEAYALHEACPHAHGRMPFIGFRREEDSDLFETSRGIPELSATDQYEMKLQRDATADRTQWAANPPLKTPILPGQAGGRMNLRPGIEIPTPRTGVADVLGWMAPPPYDAGNIEIQRQIKEAHDGYWGRGGKVDPDVRLIHRQDLVDGWLSGLREAYRMTFQLIQQFADSVRASSIAGVPVTLEATREDIQGEFDLQLTFDAADLDLEMVDKRLSAVAKLLVPLDTDAVLDRGGLMKVAFRTIAPSWAERLIRDPQTASRQEIDDEDDALAKMRAGIEPTFSLGKNHALRLQRLQENMAKSPSLQAAVQGDPVFAALLQARIAMHQQQITQEENKQVGRLGAKAVLG